MKIIERKIQHIIRSVLNEELGINQDVYEGANKILNKIKNDVATKIENHKTVSVLDGDAYRIRGSFSIKLLGVTILVTYNSYIFENNETYVINKRKHPKMLMNAGASYNSGSPSLFVVYNCVNGVFDESIYDRVQHELNHCFQTLKKGGVMSTSDLRNKVDVGLTMRNKDMNIFMASFILYCARKYEQDACVNGLYSWLQNGMGDKDKIIRNSAIVRNRRICLKYLDDLSHIIGNKTEEERIHSMFGITLNKIISKGYNTCEEMKIKANRTIFKYIKETGNKVNFIK